jgi:deoxyribonucleoside regulator
MRLGRQVGSDMPSLHTVDVLTDVATRHYLRGESQIAIARSLGLAPSTVSRYLQRARDEGIVHVEIRAPRRDDVDLGRALASAFGLSRVAVAPASADHEPLGAVAADLVDGLLRAGLRLGISWGRTLAQVVRHLRPGSVSGLVIAQLAGGVEDPHPNIQGHELVGELADLYPGSRVHYLHAPAIVRSAAVRRMLVGDPTIAAGLDAARRSEVALVGVGQMTEGGTLVEGRHVDPVDWRRLLATGAVGNLNTRFFDAAGRPVPELERRTIAIEWKELRAIPTVIAVAAGADKVAAIRGALRTGCVDVLATDEPTAVAVLETG